MVRLRQPRYVTSGEWYVPDLRDVIADRAWTERAACLGEDALFTAESGSRFAEPRLTSSTDLLRLLYCASCSVRTECLRASLQPPEVPGWTDTETYGHAVFKRTDGVPREWGVWGGADDRDRLLTQDLAFDERAALLESTFPERLEARIAGWRSSVRHRLARGGPISKRDRLVAAILGDEMPAKPRQAKPRRPKLFRVGGRGGPGRGHRSKIGRYAEIEGISYSTAWRRLRAS